MNWFTSRVVESASVQEKQKLLAQDGGCEHVETDASLGYIVHTERDSFGIVGTCLLCKACNEAAQEEADNEEHTCVDCKQSVKQKDGIFWKWYDFYAAQGDEALFVCDCCRTQPAHVNRVKRDERERQEEFGDDD